MSALLWFLWVPILWVATAPVLQWHIRYFNSPGVGYYRLALMGIPAVIVLAWIYLPIRQRFLWRYELLALGAFVSVALFYYEPRATLVLFGVFLTCCASGNGLIRMLHLDIANPLDRITVGFGVGCGTLITVLFVLGLLNLYYPVVFLLLVIAPPLVLWRDLRGIIKDVRLLHQQWADSIEQRHPIVGLAMLFAFAAASCTLMSTLAPSVVFDSLSVHLPSVQFYASSHGLSPVPRNDYSYFPQGAELLQTLAYSLAGQAGAQMVSILFFVLFLALLFRIGRACIVDRGASLTGVVFAGTMPFLNWTGSVLKNDLAMALFQALAFYAFILWLGKRNFRWILVGTFFLAQSFGVKHVALFGAVPMAMLFGYAVWRQPRRWSAAATVMAVFLTFGTCWLARTYVLKGNPLFPESAGRTTSGGLAAHGTTLLDTAARYLNLPGQLIFHGRSAFESPLDNPAGIVLFAFAPFALWGLHRSPRTGVQIAAVVFVVVYLAYWATILNTLRYAILPLSLIAMFLAARLKAFYDAQHGPVGLVVRFTLIGAETYCLILAVIGIMIIEVNGPQFSYFAGKNSKTAYLMSALRTYPSLQYLRTNGEKSATVFGVNNCTRAYAPDPGKFDCELCPSEKCTIDLMVTKSAGASYLIFPEDGQPPGLLEKLGNGAAPELMFRDGYFRVYRIKPRISSR